MNMNLIAAKKTLYNKLRNFPEVVGAGIKAQNSSEYIVIYLTKRSSSILRKIPEKYKGITVKTEVKGTIEAF